MSPCRTRRAKARRLSRGTADRSSRALRALRPGGTVAIAGIHLTDIPSLPYAGTLFQERTLTSVTANTRADGEGLLREAAAIGLKPKVTTFPLAEANAVLRALAEDRVSGTAVLLP